MTLLGYLLLGFSVFCLLASPLDAVFFWPGVLTFVSSVYFILKGIIRG